MKMEKIFSSLRPLTDEHNKGKPKICATCPNMATQEALFDVGGGITLIERYCDICVINVGGVRPAHI